MEVLNFFQGIYTFFLVSPGEALARVFLIALGLLFLYLGYRRTLEPLLMIPMGIGMLGVNGGVLIFEANNIRTLGTLFVNPLVSNTDLLQAMQINFLQPIYSLTFSNGLIACLVFMGIGAITEIDFLIAKPYLSLFLAAFAELGTIVTLPIAMAMGLTVPQAASISLVGGADGPMVLFGSLRMAPELFVPIAVVAYVYLSVCYVGYPYLAKIIPREQRGIEMNFREIPEVSPGAKFAFAVIGCAVLCILFPVAAPLFASFFVGLAVKEAGVTRLTEFLAGPVLYGSTFFLGFTLGALLGTNVILDPHVWLLLVLGMIALTLSGIGGIAGGLLWNKFAKKKINPLIGLAAVSCVPTTAKVAQKCAYQVNKKCMILPFAMGPNVAGVITTAIVTGIYISGVKLITG